jgi:hypothetical protein
MWLNHIKLKISYYQLLKYEKLPNKNLLLREEKRRD